MGFMSGLDGLKGVSGRGLKLSRASHTLGSFLEGRGWYYEVSGGCKEFLGDSWGLRGVSESLRKGFEVSSGILPEVLFWIASGFNSMIPSRALFKITARISSGMLSGLLQQFQAIIFQEILLRFLREFLLEF